MRTEVRAVVGCTSTVCGMDYGGMSCSSGHRALRKGRVSLPGQVYLLTTTTAHRRPWFSVNPLCARAVCRCMVEPACWRDSRLLSWVLMPDHWHGLLELGETGDLSKIMNRFKAHATRNVRRLGFRERLWARGFHDHALRRYQGVLEAARYVVANPVRAGLVTSVLAYPYWDSIWMSPTNPEPPLQERLKI